MKSLLLARHADGIPPEVLQWPVTAGTAEALALGLFSPVPIDAATLSVLAPPARALISYEGRPHLAPVSVHIQNWLWIDKRTFDRLGLPVPKTWDDILAAGRVLRQHGIQPISASTDLWTRERIVLDVLAASAADPAFRRSIQKRDGLLEVVGTPGFETALRRLEALKPLLSPMDRPMSWSQATAEVAAGRAGMNFMGDWAKGEFLLAGLEIDEDILCVRPPGNDWLARVAIDAFALTPTEDPAVRDAQALLVRTMLDPRTQIAFSAVKGAVPVRVDVAPERLDSCARAILDAYRDPDTVYTFDLDKSSGEAVELWLLLTDVLSDPAVTADAVLAEAERLAAR
jgi:glucose/mannose transport system substrate-binding protein